MKQHRKKQSTPNTSHVDMFIVIQYLIDGMYWVAGWVIVVLLLHYAANFINKFIVQLNK